MISSKFKWIIGLTLVFVLIVTTNLIDRNNFKRIKESIVTIYEDRLIAKNYVFELSLLLEEKSLALASGDSTFFSGENKKVNEQINSFLTRFHQTKLTNKEESTLRSFEDDYEKLITLEQSGDRSRVKDQIERLKEDLYTLSEIQLDEGKKQLMIGSKAVSSVELLTRLEIIMLIIIAGLVQLILIYSPKKPRGG